MRGPPTASISASGSACAKRGDHARPVQIARRLAGRTRMRIVNVPAREPARAAPHPSHVERERERGAPFGRADDFRRISAHRRDERGEFETERVGFGGAQRHGLHDLLEAGTGALAASPHAAA